LCISVKKLFCTLFLFSYLFYNNTNETTPKKGIKFKETKRTKTNETKKEKKRKKKLFHFLVTELRKE